jgi:hypothetical protein
LPSFLDGEVLKLRFRYATVTGGTGVLHMKPCEDMHLVREISTVWASKDLLAFLNIQVADYTLHLNAPIPFADNFDTCHDKAACALQPTFTKTRLQEILRLF